MKDELRHGSSRPCQLTASALISTSTETNTKRHASIDWQRVFKDVGDRLRAKYGKEWDAQELARRAQCELVELPDWDDDPAPALTSTAGATRVLL